MGKTAKGGEISITITDNSATQYMFRGESVTINDSGAKGKAFQMGVGQMNGTVKLTKVGAKKARYSYSDSGGGNASASLSRQ